MTKNEIIARLKNEYPVLTKQIDQEIITLSEDEYEVTISSWADAELDELAKEEAVAEEKAKRETALSKLAALGLDTNDLNALGL